MQLGSMRMAEMVKDFSMTYEIHLFDDVHRGGELPPNMTSASSFFLDTSPSHLAKPHMIEPLITFVHLHTVAF